MLNAWRSGLGKQSVPEVVHIGGDSGSERWIGGSDHPGGGGGIGVTMKGSKNQVRIRVIRGKEESVFPVPVRGLSQAEVQKKPQLETTQQTHLRIGYSMSGVVTAAPGLVPSPWVLPK
jgi:hypothetical protein